MAAKKSCCVTGHRILPTAILSEIEAPLREEFRRALANGCTHFISGFANGAELMFAQIVATAKQESASITLEAALPYPSSAKSKDPLFKSLLSACDAVGVHSASCTAGCYARRARYMIDTSARVILLHDGRKTGGGAYAARYAQKTQKEIRTVWPSGWWGETGGEGGEDEGTQGLRP